MKLSLILILLVATVMPAFGNGELSATTLASSTVYAVIESTGQPWNGSTFESFADADWGEYAIAMTEQGSSQQYVGNFPTSIAVIGKYPVVYYKQIGGSPAESDTVLSKDSVYWTGSQTALIEQDTPGTTTLLSRLPGPTEPQTGDSFSLLGTPVNSTIDADVNAAPATTVTNLTATTSYQELVSYAAGKFTYSPVSHVLTLYAANDTSVLATLTLTIDSNGNITNRQ